MSLADANSANDVMGVQVDEIHAKRIENEACIHSTVQRVEVMFTSRPSSRKQGKFFLCMLTGARL